LPSTAIPSGIGLKANAASLYSPLEPLFGKAWRPGDIKLGQ
jgi:hypothetical protein